MKKIYSFGVLLMFLGLVNTYYQFAQLPPDYYKKRTADLIIIEAEQKLQSESEQVENYFKRIRLLMKKNRYKEAIELVETSQKHFDKSEVSEMYIKKQEMIMLELYMAMAFKKYYKDEKRGLSNITTTNQNDYLLKAEALLKKINNQRPSESLEKE